MPYHISLYFWPQLVLLALPATMQEKTTAKTWSCIILKVLSFSFKALLMEFCTTWCFSLLRFHLLRARQCLGQVIQTLPFFDCKLAANFRECNESSQLLNGISIEFWEAQLEAKVLLFRTQEPAQLTHLAFSDSQQCGSFKYNIHWRISCQRKKVCFDQRE